MNVVIMGCGRVGARLAGQLDSEGHRVTVMDVDPYSFRRIPPNFGGQALVGSGCDEEALIKAGIETANVFVATTQGDNRNVLACQVAKHIFNVPRSISRIYDPIRQELYAELGLETTSPTKTGADALRDLIGG